MEYPEDHTGQTWAWIVGRNRDRIRCHARVQLDIRRRHGMRPYGNPLPNVRCDIIYPTKKSRRPAKRVARREGRREIQEQLKP